MAFTIMLMAVTLIVAFTDGLAEPNFDPFSQVTIGYMPALPLPQPQQFPGYPQIRLHQPPPFIHFNNQRFPFKPMKPLKPFDPIYPFPNEETIANTNAKDYKGLYAKLTSSNGQETAQITVNDGGKFGFKAHKKPKFPSLWNTPFQYDTIPNFEFPSFEPIVIDPVIIEPFNFDNIRHRVPSPGEKFSCHAHNEQSSYSNDNGVVKSKVAVADLDNNNGKVVENVRVHEIEP